MRHSAVILLNEIANSIETAVSGMIGAIRLLLSWLRWFLMPSPAMHYTGLRLVRRWQGMVVYAKVPLLDRLIGAPETG
jgi:hypothetical protein